MKNFLGTFSLEASWRPWTRAPENALPDPVYQPPVSALFDSLLSGPAVFSLFRRGLQLSYWVNRRVHLGKGGVRAPAPSTETRSCPGVCRDLFQESFILLGRPFQYPLVHVTSKMSSVLTPVDLRGTMDRNDSMHWDYQTRESAPS